MLIEERALTFHTPPQQPNLKAAEVHLWLATVGTTPDLDTSALSAEEWLRAGRFHHSIDRDRYICTRAIVRQILAQYEGTEPAALEFERSAYGKPSLPGSLLRFNLSHSEDLMLLAVTHGRELGVDLEFVKENLSFEMLADHYFAPEDQWSLRTSPAEERIPRFFQIWTATEAQLKARGLGLSENIQFSDSDRFTLQTFHPAPGYTAALAVEGQSCKLLTWQWPN